MAATAYILCWLISLKERASARNTAAAYHRCRLTVVRLRCSLQDPASVQQPAVRRAAVNAATVGRQPKVLGNLFVALDTSTERSLNFRCFYLPDVSPPHCPSAED